jgi:hypothetical protein
MGVRVPRETAAPFPGRPAGPTATAVALVAALVFLILICNGRPLDSGDTRANERVAASLVQEHNFDLDEYPDVEAPFSRMLGAHRVSIYPVLAPLLATPVFAVARLVFPLDETGCALAGKWAASLLSALSAALLFVALGRRSSGQALPTVCAFAFGTSVWSTSQALWQHPAALVFLAWALVWMLKSEDDDVWAGRLGLPLALAVAARHADVVLVAVLAIGVSIRWPRRIPWLLLWATPVAACLLAYQWLSFGSPWAHGFTGSLGRFSEPWGRGQLGLLLSPAKGLFVFTPVAVVAIVGLVSAARRGEAWLATTLGAAALGHWILIGRWSEWHGGECFGPRMLTDVLPLLFLFLPDGMALSGALGRLLLALSVAVQALGAFAYDYRWERLFQRPPQASQEALWNWAESPILFQVQERVLLPALPGLADERAIVREHPMVLLGPTGSRVSFVAGGSVVKGSEDNLGNVLLQRGARVEAGRLSLRGRWDALFLRVERAARSRPLELRVLGRGRGVLYVGERSFWSAVPRWATYPVNGSFLIRHAYSFADSGGPDLSVTVGKNGGDAEIESVSLVAPGDPLSVLAP